MKKILLAILALIIGFAGGFIVHAILTPSGIGTGEDAPVPATYDLSVTADYALGVMQKEMPADTGLSVTALQINAPCSLAVAGEVSTSALTGKLSGFTAFLAKLLPEKIGVTLTAELSVEEGKLAVKVTSISLQNLTVGEKLIPSSLKKYISDTVENAAGEIAGSFGEIEALNAAENTLFITMK